MSTADLVGRVLISITIFLIVFMVNIKFQSIISKKFKLELKNPKKITILSGLFAILPNLDVILVWIVMIILQPDYPDVFFVNNINIWSHWPLLILLAIFGFVFFGIGKWKWQIVAQSLLIGYFIHLLLDLILYGIPIFFVYPFTSFDVQLYGLFLASPINFHLFPYFTEIAILVVVIIIFVKSNKKFSFEPSTGEKSELIEKTNNLEAPKEKETQ
jgi:hypothetical protein